MKLWLHRIAVTTSVLVLFSGSSAAASIAKTEASVVRVEGWNALQSQMPSITVGNVRYLPIFYVNSLLHKSACVAQFDRVRRSWTFGDQSYPHPKTHFVVHDDKTGSVQIVFDDHLAETHVPAMTHVDPWSRVSTLWIPAVDVRRSLKMTNVVRSDSWIEHSSGSNATWVINNAVK